MEPAKSAVSYRKILLTELVSNYLPMYPEPRSWENTANYLYEKEPEHMEELARSLKKHGHREPVILSREEPGEEQLVLDGTHRVSIALREGVFSLPWAHMDELERDDEPLLAVRVKLANGGVLSQEEEELFLDKLRSFSLNESIWVTSAVAFGSRGSWEILYDISDRTKLKLLGKRAKAILKLVFPEHEFKVIGKQDSAS